MCGIVGGFTPAIEAGVNALTHRGPDAQACLQVGTLIFGHTRLAILDLDARSNQPFQRDGLTLVYNGELWNYQALRAELQALGQTFTTTGDTEVFAAALAQWGVDALPKFDGMFACAWTSDGGTLYLARDRFGEIPLHIAKQKPFLFASELKALLALKAHPQSFADLPPGHYAIVTAQAIQVKPYYDAPLDPSQDTRPQASARLFELLGDGALNRTIADVPVCTLLSGGIDSAAVAYFLAQRLPNLVAYTAVHDLKSSDLKNARLTAQALGIELREIPIPTPTAQDLGRVIQCIEMPYKAQIEIGWACLCLAEVMHADGFKVTFSGEGSDELWASYGFAYHALKTQDWHQYRKDLFLTQARKNFVRCNKIFMAHSIECRLPFLHTPLVEYALSLRADAVQNGKSKPKAVMQEGFTGVLPYSVTHRAKVAFQDGLGLKAAITHVLSNPEKFYRAEYANQYC